MDNYTDINSGFFDKWVKDGWEWGIPVSSEVLRRAREGVWDVLLTPVKPVPHAWFGDIRGRRILGLASGGGQQMPVFSVLGAHCTVLDYSAAQLESERLCAEREDYKIEIVRADMTKPLPFESGSFDIVFNPVSNCYIKDTDPVFAECFRVLRRGGRLLAGLDNGINFAYSADETVLESKLPYDPLSDPRLYKASIEEDLGIQFSHSIEEQIGGQLRAGFVLRDIYEDTNGSGILHDHGIPTFYATMSEKP